MNVDRPGQDDKAARRYLFGCRAGRPRRQDRNDTAILYGKVAARPPAARQDYITVTYYQIEGRHRFILSLGSTRRSEARA
jgi:hypothetical protein